MIITYNWCQFCPSSTKKAVIAQGGSVDNPLTQLCAECFDIYCMAQASEEELNSRARCMKCGREFNMNLENYNVKIVDTLLGSRFEYYCDGCKK